MEPSVACVELVKYFEGFRATAYRDPAGGWAIGYGHSTPAKYPGIMAHSNAEMILAGDLANVSGWFNVHLARQVKQHEYDALCSLAFNIGVGRLKKSALFRYVACGRNGQAAAQFERWRYAGGRVQPGLVKRRQAEAALFSTGRWST